MKKITPRTSVFFLCLFFIAKSVLPANIDSLLLVLKTAKDTARGGTLVAIVTHYAQNGDETALRYLAEIDNYAMANQNYDFKARANQLRGLYWYNKHDLKKSIEFYNKALPHFRTSGNERELSRTLNNLGLALSEFGEAEKAIDLYKEAIELRRKSGDSAAWARTLNNLGMAYMETSQYRLSLEVLQQSISIDERNGNLKGVGGAYTNMGNTYSNLEEHQEALKCYQKALEYYTMNGDKKRIASSYNNIGTIYQRIKDYDKAEEFHKKALEIRTALKDEKGLATTYTNLGVVESYKKNYTGAIIFLEKALELKEKFADKFSLIFTLYSLGETELKLMRLPAAEKHLNRALQLATELKSPGQLKDIYIYLSLLNEEKNNPREALRYMKMAVELKDSLFQIESIQRIAEMEAKFNNETQRRKIELMTEEKRLEEEEKKRKEIILWIVGIAGLVSLVMVVIAIIGNVQKNKANKNLERKNREVSEKNSEITKQKAIIEEKNKDILDSIQYAKRIQQGILPDVEHLRTFLPDSFVLFLPKDIVSGDFYWFETVKAGVPDTTSVLLAAVDCTGHGVPGAFVTFLGHNALNRCVNEFHLTQPSAILDKLSFLVEEAFSKSTMNVMDGMDVSLCHLVMNEKDKSADLQFAGANNPLYIIRQGAAEVEIVEADHQPVGKYFDKKPFKNNQVKLQKGDMVFLFSDGFADQFGGAKGKKFKYAQLRSLLLNHQNGRMEEIAQALRTSFLSWKGNFEQVDDVCVVGFRV